ncbi:MAG: UbiD family decarboxylase [Bacillota bacterium]
MFREYLQTLREHRQLVDIDRPVELDYELASVTEAMLEQDRPIGLFQNVVHPSGIPVVGGLLGNIRRIALAMGTEPQDISARLEHALAHLIEPQVVEDAPFKENVVLGDDIRLRELLPIPWHNRGDAGPYVTSGLMIGRDPDTGRHNYSYNRLQIKGPRRTGINMNAWRHLADFYEKAEQRGQPLPVAVVIGVDPAVEIAAGFRIEEDEAMLAGAIRGKPLPVCKCSTLDILVPADAEIVLEGHLLPRLREPEGPLAEFTGHFGEVYQNPVFEVSAVSYRNNPIYRTLIPGTFEHIYIGNVLPREIKLRNLTRYVSPNVRAVHLAPYASGFMAIVAIDKKNQGEPKNIALAALTAHVNIKAAVVVDTDIDIYQPTDILWAMATRVDARRDIITIPYAQGMENDPTTDAEGMQSKYAVDATLDLAIKDDYRRVRYPAVDLEKFLGGGNR